MNEVAIRNAVVDALRSVAPESDPTSLDETARLRDELDLDSMDFLNFVIAVHTSLHVDIPEADYGKVQTLGGAVRYLASKLEPRLAR
jgi:acyl carrier protein